MLKSPTLFNTCASIPIFLFLNSKLNSLSASNSTGAKPGSYKCWTCKKKFSTREILNSHKLKHKKRTYYCTRCTKYYKSKFSLIQHERTTHDGKLYKCPDESCAKKFKTYQSFRDHKEIHANKFKYTCELCGHGFMKSDHFNDHLNRHAQVKPFSCYKCSRKFTRKNELRRHLNKTCVPVSTPRVTCKLCGKSLKNTDCLRNHMSQVHEEGEKKICPYCDEVSSYHPSTIDRHIRKKHPEKV